MKYKIGSLFAGIGGFELGFEATGQFETAWQVECDKYALQVLEKHWPNVARHNDVITWPAENTEPVDVVLAGFPCQDISYAGMGAGLNGKRSGLFYEAMRIVRVLGPKFVVLENVAALFTRGMDQVLGTLAALGYDAEWEIVSAASVGAPHRRDRVFIIGWNTGGSGNITNAKSVRRNEIDPNACRCVTGTRAGEECRSGHGCGDLADSDGTQCKRIWLPSGIHAGNANANSASFDRRKTQEMADSASVRQSGPGMCARSFGTTKGSNGKADHVESSGQGKENHWHVEPALGRVADGVPRRVDRLRCLGNAIVPQVAEVVADRLLEIIDEQNAKPVVQR